MDSPASRPAALRVVSSPSADMTGIRPASFHRISPVPLLKRSKPLIRIGNRPACADHTKPSGDST